MKRNVTNPLKGVAALLVFTCFSFNSEAQQGQDTLSHFDLNESTQGEFTRYQGSPGSCNWGYIYGHSCQGNDGFAERFYVNDSVHVKGIMAHIASKGGNTLDTLKAGFKVYNTSNNDIGNEIASKELLFQDMMVSSIPSIPQVKNFQSVMFQDTVIAHNSFYTSFEIPSHGTNYDGEDTLAIQVVGRDEFSGSNDTISNVTLYRNGGMWSSTTNLLNNNGDIFYYMAPIVAPVPTNDTTNDTTNAVPENPLLSNGGANLYGAYPNPVEDQTKVVFSTNKRSDVSISVYTVNGQKVLSKDYSTLPIGKHEVALEVSELRPGNYIYTVETDNGLLSGQLSKQ